MGRFICVTVAASYASNFGGRDMNSRASEGLIGRPASPRASGRGRTAAVVQRGALFDRLSETSGVALVCAPAGSGKTVLLHSWVQAAGLQDRLAWVSVRRGEQDSQRFWL